MAEIGNLHFRLEDVALFDSCLSPESCFPARLFVCVSASERRWVEISFHSRLVCLDDQDHQTSD